MFLTASFLHDVIVKEIDGRWIMLLSYWDGGWVLLDVTDPANPEFIADTDYEAVDPLLLEELGVALPPEGNAHQAEFTIDNRFIIGTDEDFAPYKLFMSIAGGAPAPVSAGTATPVDEDVYIGPGETLTAPTTFLGTACGTIAAATTDPAIAVVERGGCFFHDKIDNLPGRSLESPRNPGRLHRHSTGEHSRASFWLAEVDPRQRALVPKDPHSSLGEGHIDRGDSLPEVDADVHIPGEGVVSDEPGAAWGLLVPPQIPHASLTDVELVRRDRTPRLRPLFDDPNGDRVDPNQGASVRLPRTARRPHAERSDPRPVDR